MKIVYVGDNRNRGNYGCRGTSTALSQLISNGGHEIVGRISGNYTNYNTGELYFVKGISKNKYERMARLKNWEYIRKILYLYHRYRARGGKYLFGKYDFVSLDFESAIKNLVDCLPANPYLKEFDLRQYEFDALVVNGEGSFIFATPPWRESVIEAMEIYWAKKLGKKVFFMNAMLSDDPHSEHNTDTVNCMQSIFNMCDAVCVREYKSLSYIQKYFPDVKAKLFPDALFTWYEYINDNHTVENGRYYIPQIAATDESYYQFDFTKPYVCISGSSAIIGACKGDLKIAIESYKELVKNVKSELKMNVYLVNVCEGDEFLNAVGSQTNTPVIPLDMPLLAAAKILANSVIFISGRYHPAILASLGGTPCIFMGSNSHKTTAIQELLQYDSIHEYNLLPDENECRLIIEEAKIKIATNGLRDKIKNRAKLLSQQAKNMIRVLNDVK